MHVHVLVMSCNLAEADDNTTYLIVLLGPDDLCVGVGQAFPPVRKVASHTRDGKEDGEELGWEAHGPVHQPCSHNEHVSEAAAPQSGVA